MRKQFVFTICLAAMLLARSASNASAQPLTSLEAPVVLTAELLESLTIVPAPGAVNFLLTGGSANNPGSTPIVVTTVWTLALTRTKVRVYAYFLDSTKALTPTLVGGTDIPSAKVEANINGGSRVAFDQTVPWSANAGREIGNSDIALATIVGTRIDNVVLNINLQSFPIPAGVYTGILRFRAQATP
jgi:hypothetical protein